MKCLNPICITDCRDYEVETRYHGKIFLPCGKCEACRNSDAICWRVRLKEEFYSSRNAYFITLTYDDSKLNFARCKHESIDYGFFPIVNKPDIQKFFKRFRKIFSDYYKYQEEKFKYFLVSEYGPTTFRPHYHAILFNLPDLSVIPEVQLAKITKKLQEIWGNGFIKLDKCNENRIAYCTKYMACETIIPPYLPKPFRLISKGIGISYLDKEERIKWHKKDLNCYYPDGVYKLRLPRYYKDKIFSEDEKVMISQLNSLRESEVDREHEHRMMTREDAQTFTTRIEKYKRDYKKKSLKNRKF